MFEFKNKCFTFNVKIFIALSPGYSDSFDYSKSYLTELIEKYVKKNKFSVNLQDTRFILPDGIEEGCIIELIQHPRFLVKEEIVLENAVHLAYHLMKKINQFRCTIKTPKETFILENQYMAKSNWEK